MLNHFKTAILLTLILTILTGLIYPLTVTLIAKTFFPYQASGSLIRKDKTVIGSKLIAQDFKSPKYFHPRPSVSNHDPVKSGGSNLGPTSKVLINRIIMDVQKLQKENPHSSIPIDLVTESGSGLDPHISIKAAEFQIPRIAKARNITQEKIYTLIKKYSEGKLFGLYGESRVNVLLLNLDLDK